MLSARLSSKNRQGAHIAVADYVGANRPERRKSLPQHSKNLNVNVSVSAIINRTEGLSRRVS